MTNTLLDKLRDIHLPKPISWWPLAPGWYFLVLVGLVILVVISLVIGRRYCNGRAKYQALRLLAEYERDYDQCQQHSDQHVRQSHNQIISANISELLKRVALAYFPREMVASLQGEAWINFLNSTSKNINFTFLRDCLLELPYQSESRDVNLKPLILSARAWIKQRGMPCSN